MVTTARIAAAAQIDVSYLPDGANFTGRLTHGSLGPRKSAPKRHLDRLSRFCRA